MIIAGDLVSRARADTADTASLLRQAALERRRGHAVAISAGVAVGLAVTALVCALVLPAVASADMPWFMFAYRAVRPLAFGVIAGILVWAMLARVATRRYQLLSTRLARLAVRDGV